MTPRKVFTLRRPLFYSEKVDALWTPRHHQPGALGRFSVVLHAPWFLPEHASRIFSPRNLMIRTYSLRLLLQGKSILAAGLAPVRVGAYR